MSTEDDNRKKLQQYKFAARFTGFFVCTFFMLFIIGEGVPDIMKGHGDDLITFIPLVLLPVAGYLIAWRRPWGDGLLMISGAFILLVYFLIKGDVRMALWYNIPFVIAGLLFLVQVKMFNTLKEKK